MQGMNARLVRSLAMKGFFCWLGCVSGLIAPADTKEKEAGTPSISLGTTNEEPASNVPARMTLQPSARASGGGLGLSSDSLDDKLFKALDDDHDGMLTLSEH